MRPVWADGEAYEPFVGRWSRRVAPRFVAWLGQADDWCDVGCGTGAPAHAVLAGPARRVLGVEPSAAFLALARRGADGRFAGWSATPPPWSRCAASPGPAGSSPRTCGTTPGAWSCCAGSGTPPSRSTRPPRRSTRAAARPARPGPLAGSFTGAGLQDVAVEPIVVDTVFRDVDDLWLPFLGGQGSAPGYVAGLSSDHRAALRERLLADLPVRADGSVPLTARAWAVRGRR